MKCQRQGRERERDLYFISDRDSLYVMILH